MNHRYRPIMGKNCIRELLKSSPERLVEVYTSQEDDPLLLELKEARIPIKKRSKKELTDLVESDSHQSFVAFVKERSQSTLKEFLSEEREKSLVVMLDSIFDPHNLGAILRAAECFGADLVVFSKNRGTDVTPVVTKVSAGASELVPMIKVSNLADTIKPFQDAGYWVGTADAGGESIYDFQFPEKFVLILGSEGEGVRALLKKRADHCLSIPMLGNIDSLNVSQAAATFLAFYRSRLG